MGVSTQRINKQFNTQLKCLKYLEKLRWGKTVNCSYCGSDDVRIAKGENRRYACRICGRTFSVFVDTIFEDTRLDLPTWFTAIALTLNSKSGISAKEIQRQTNIESYKTAYYVAMRIRIGMLDVQNTKLSGIIEMDDAYFSSSRKKDKYERKDAKNQAALSSVKLKRGRGTKSTSAVGAVQRKGNIRTKVIEKLTKRNLLYMLKQYAKQDNSILMTDAFKSYKGLSEYIERLEIEHKKQFSKGIVHVNTIEGFWSYVKNGIKGSYKSISPKYLPFYLIEYEWKFNHRSYRGDEFEKFLRNALAQEKELEYWKAQSPEHVKNIAYET